jgi:hypothetical protein
MTDDQMIEYVDVEQLTGIDNLLGDSYILRGRHRVTARVVVNDDDCCHVAAQCLFEDLANADDSGVERTYVEGDNILYPILGVEEHDTQLLMAEQTHSVFCRRQASSTVALMRAARVGVMPGIAIRSA